MPYLPGCLSMSTCLSNCWLLSQHFDSYLLPSSTIPIDSHNALGNAESEPDPCPQTPVFRQTDCRRGLAARGPCRSNKIRICTCDKSIGNWKIHRIRETKPNNRQCQFHFMVIYHVIAATVLFNAGVTLWARFCVLTYPFSRFGIIRIFPSNQTGARHWLMPILHAIKTKIVATFAWPWHGGSFHLLSGSVQTVSRWTPLYCFVVLRKRNR